MIDDSLNDFLTLKRVGYMENNSLMNDTKNLYSETPVPDKEQEEDSDFEERLKEIRKNDIKDYISIRSMVIKLVDKEKLNQKYDHISDREVEYLPFINSYFSDLCEKFDLNPSFERLELVKDYDLKEQTEFYILRKSDNV